jgi:hypothetical protein
VSINLNQILALVGKLDDSAGDETPRERFRRFLKENVNEVGQVRDYVEECLRTSGDQYSRALQDLVNYLGHFLGFEVIFGRYQGVQGQVGFDGHWKTETYAVKTSTLVGYVDALISEKRIPDWGNALGLYVVGRPDPEIRQLENAIIAEKRTHQLRVISVESLLSLAEMMNEYDVSHHDILAVLRPSGPTIDLVIDLMSRLVAQPQAEELQREPAVKESTTENEIAYWLTSIKSDKDRTAEDVIHKLVSSDRVYAFGERTPGRKDIKPGDWICFYATTNGVVAHAKVTSRPEKKPHPGLRHPEKYPWIFRLDSVRIYLDAPVVIDAALRSQLKAYEGKDIEAPWSWFVQATRRLAPEDFKLLTRQDSKG